jgi:multidrug efflux pump subunit AcrA (membrane-fusion protein)
MRVKVPKNPAPWLDIRENCFCFSMSRFDRVGQRMIDLSQLDVSTLVSNPKVTAEGTVREIAPAVDTNSGTVRVKIGIRQTPPAMTLGAVVTGSGNLKSSRAVRN